MTSRNHDSCCQAGTGAEKWPLNPSPPSPFSASFYPSCRSLPCLPSCRSDLWTLPISPAFSELWGQASSLFQSSLISTHLTQLRDSHPATGDGRIGLQYRAAVKPVPHTACGLNADCNSCQRYYLGQLYIFSGFTFLLCRMEILTLTSVSGWRIQRCDTCKVGLVPGTWQTVNVSCCF